MSRLPIPDDWGEEDGWVQFMVCVPNSVKWRAIVRGAIDNLTRGRKWDERTGNIKATQEVAKRIYDSMRNCNDLLKVQRMFVAALVGESVDLTDEQNLIPNAVDYSENGLVPTLQALLNVDRTLYPDMNVAEVAFHGLIGRRVAIPIPFDGTGLADIADEQLDILHNRLRMTDTSLFNPVGEKNVVEALETLFRRDSFSDVEVLPNIATIMEKSLNIGGTSGPLVTLLKSLISTLASNLNLPQVAIDWLNDKLDEENQLSVADLLLLLAQAMEQFGGIEPQTNIQINNHTVCGNGDCLSDGDDDNITIQLNDDGATVIEDGGQTN